MDKLYSQNHVLLLGRWDAAPTIITMLVTAAVAAASRRRKKIKKNHFFDSPHTRLPYSIIQSELVLYLLT
ncbi:MAG: hypothetical protein K8T10_09570 [Candidatus Eremiobacteraeota bacterium]|nr:hypothetical protein [Candidatus Eremiobacteraeota bacterium]